jgi:hypothetical protein
MVVLSMALLIGLLLMLQRMVYRKFWDAGLSARLSFTAREAYEGERLELLEELTNAKPLPLPWVNAKFQLSRNLIFAGADNFKVSDYYYQNDLFSIGMYQKVTRRQGFICGRRGFYSIRSMDLGSSSILITDKLIKHIECSADLTVFPRPAPYPMLAPVFRQLQGDIEIRRFINLDPFSFRGLREYDPRDDFRLINFIATAKTGDLIVNVHSATSAQELIILLNVEPYSEYQNEHVIEEGIRIAASAAEYFGGLGLTVSFKTNGRDISTGAEQMIPPGSGGMHVHKIFENLARIDLQAGQNEMWKLLEAIRDDEPAYFLISSNDDQHVYGAFQKMLTRGLRVRWVIPASATMAVRVGEDEYITRWDVRTIDKSTYFNPGDNI